MPKFVVIISDQETDMDALQLKAKNKEEAREMVEEWFKWKKGYSNYRILKIMDRYRK